MEKKIKIDRDGPYIVTGKIPLKKEIILTDKEGFAEKWQEGESIETKEEYHLCRCGQSKDMPFCDNSHVVCDFNGTETWNKKYSDCARRIEGKDIDLFDCEELCASAKFCDRRGGTWQLVKEDSEESKKLAIEQACNCPSGRLVMRDKDGKEIEPKLNKEISLVEDNLEKVSGPLWIKGKIPVESSDGKEYERRNRVTLCRCGKSKNKPFCDCEHIRCKFNDGHYNQKEINN